MIKKFFRRSSSPSPVSIDPLLTKKYSKANIAKKITIGVVVLAAGGLLISRLPFNSSASNLFSNRTNDINLSPLLSGNYAASTNNFSIAIKNLEASLKDRNLSPDAKNTIYQQLFILNIKNGNFSAANRLTEKLKPLIEDAQPQNIGFSNLVNLFITINQIKTNQWDGNILSDASTGGFGTVGTAIIAAWGDASRDNGEDALDELNDLAKNNPTDGEVLSQRDLMKLLLKKPISLNDLTGNDQAVKVGNLSLSQSRIYLQSLNQEKKWNDMKTFLDDLDHPLPLTLLGDEERIKNQTPLTALVEKPEDGLSYFLLDIAANLLASNPDSALLFCQLALFANSKNTDAQFLLATIQSNIGLAADALDILNGLKKNKNHVHIANLQETLILRSLGDSKKAKQNLISLTKRHPTIIDYQLALGEFNMSEKNYRDAEKNYQAAIELSRNYTHNRAGWFYYFQHGVSLERQNQWALAEKEFLTALSLNPDSPEVLNYLGYAWIERHKNIGQALAMLQKANKLSPNNGAILDSLGWAYYQLGKYDMARGFLEKAGQLVASDPEINEHLGDVYWQLNKKPTAQLFWKKALDNLDESASRNGLEKKIKSGL